MKTLAAIAFAAAVLMPVAEDDGVVYLTGNQLHELCQEDVAKFAKISCSMYAAGVVDTVSWLKPDLLCIPTKGVSAEQISDIVTKYLAAIGERRHAPGAMIVTFALRNAFPCQQ